MSPTSLRQRVFISHASVDADRAALLSLQLENEGVPCWIAPRDIAAGKRYAEAILDGIDECAVFLLLFSAAAGASTHVINELEHGASKDKKILLVRTDDTDPAENKQFSLFVRSHQWFDATQGPFSTHLSALVRDLRSLLESSAESATLPESHPNLAIAVPSGPAAVATETARSIGIEVSAEMIRGCVVEVGNQQTYGPVVEKEIGIEPTMRNSRGLLETVKSLVAVLVEEHFPSALPVGIGIALPGQVDVRAGTLKFGPNLFSARNLPFKTSLSGAFPRIPIRVDNDVRCAARCELHLGVGNQFDSFAWIFVDSGVGSATVIDRRIHFGNNFCAGEIGHTKVALSGPPCSCGQIGCLETFVKSQAVVDRARAIAIDWQNRGRETLLNESGADITPESFLTALEADDPAAREIASEIGERLGLGIANYLNVLNPAAVVIGGGLMNIFFFHMIDEITAGIQRNALAEVANTPIVQSSYADAGVATGAALMFDPRDGWPYP
jgi:predicted NBD/HSP70 family sugar kinase